MIYDDGSTDKTVEIIERLAEKDNRIKLIKGEVNHGGLYSRQKLLDACETEYAVWQDSDDLCAPNRFELQLMDIIQCGLVYTQWERLEYTKDSWKRCRTSPKTICLVSSMFKVDKSIKMNVNRMWGSKVWFDEMQLKYPNWKIIPSILYSLRQHPGRITLLKTKIDKLIAQGVIAEDEALALNYRQLEDLCKKYE